MLSTMYIGVYYSLWKRRFLKLTTVLGAINQHISNEEIRQNKQQSYFIPSNK
ncbi:MAG: hypothetical protein HOE80_05015 [Candidatus Magasanikbacteria bacterium]|nr:hypothetical protein [Candidatus Magasanikbacteria bacterium]MBT4072049.1 hypothetical protein [Candidatus Magasanikbacteria bacterium]